MFGGCFHWTSAGDYGLIPTGLNWQDLKVVADLTKTKITQGLLKRLKEAELYTMKEYANRK